MFESVITTALNALRVAFIMNGAASLSLLAFISHLSVNDSANVSLFACGLLYFSIGVLLVAITSFLAYCIQYYYSEPDDSICGKRYSDIGKAIHIVAVIVGISSFFMYGFGIYEIYAALSKN